VVSRVIKTRHRIFCYISFIFSWSRILPTGKADQVNQAGVEYVLQKPNQCLKIKRNRTISHVVPLGPSPVTRRHRWMAKRNDSRLFRDFFLMSSKYCDVTLLLVYRVSTTKPGHKHITHIKIIYI
jgi:hypothetical protein